MVTLFALLTAVVLFILPPLLAVCVPSPEERHAARMARAREAAALAALLATPGPLRGGAR